MARCCRPVGSGLRKSGPTRVVDSTVGTHCDISVVCTPGLCCECRCIESSRALAFYTKLQHRLLSCTPLMHCSYVSSSLPQSRRARRAASRRVLATLLCRVVLQIVDPCSSRRTRDWSRAPIIMQVCIALMLTASARSCCPSLTRSLPLSCPDTLIRLHLQPDVYL